jgi:hypothetical protein
MYFPEVHKMPPDILHVKSRTKKNPVPKNNASKNPPSLSIIKTKQIILYRDGSRKRT